MKKRYEKIADVVLLYLCAALLLVGGIGVYALPREDFSEEENRVLSDFPRVDAHALADGSFFMRLSAFYSDRIPLRKTMIRAKALCELAGGKRQNNGVLFLDGGRLVDRCEYESLDTLKANLDIMSKSFGREDTVYALVPRSVDVCVGGEESRRVTELVYSYGLCDDTLFEELGASADNGERVYYKTDHHLDSDGAYLLYANIVRSLGDTPYEKDEFEIRTVSREFLGSTYSKAGLLEVSRDEVTLYRYDGDENISVRCEDAGCEVDSLYRYRELEEKDKYEVFLGGNHGVLRVCGEGEGREELLVVKDSFANAVIPLLARHYDLTFVDPRYTDRVPSGEYAATVLVFGIDTLATGKIF